MHEPAVAAELCHEFAAGRIDIAAVDRQMRLAPVVDRGGEKVLNDI